jgi:hypothetical protein
MQESGYVTNKRKDQQPTTVPFAATLAGQPPTVKAWANLSVWTDRMLTTLEEGVRAGRWHTLIDKVIISYGPTRTFEPIGSSA